MTPPARQAVAGTERESVPEAAVHAAEVASDKLGVGTVVLSMRDLVGVTDAFVLTSGRNSRQVRTLVEEIEHQVKDAYGLSPCSIEGRRDLQWVLMDYGDFVVHVFLEETRRYYDLEHLWGDAARVWKDEDEPDGHAGRGDTTAHDSAVRQDAAGPGWATAAGAIETKSDSFTTGS
jgi:ribosome-associated protein